MKIIKKVFKMRESVLILINVLLFLIMAFNFENFINKTNIFSLLTTISINAMIAGALTILFVSGGFDISAGVMMGFASALAGRFIVLMELPIPITITLIIIIGAAIGSFMGYIIAYLGINPFFVTLAGFFILRASIHILLEKKDITGFPVKFNLIAGFKIFDISTLIIFSIISIIIFDILLRKNVYFRQNYAIGGNEIFAKLAGVKVKKVKMLNYTLVSTMAAISGIFIASRYMASYRTAGSETAFQIITAVIIGGASLGGGRGSVSGTFLGIVLMAIVFNAFVFLKLNVLWNTIAMGLTLIIVVLIDVNVMKERTVRLRK